MLRPPSGLRAIFTRSLEYARQTEYLQGRKARSSGQSDADGQLDGLRGYVWGLLAPLFGQVLAACGSYGSTCRIPGRRQPKTDNSRNLRSARSIIAHT